MRKAKQGSGRYRHLCRVVFNDRMVAYTMGKDRRPNMKAESSRVIAYIVEMPEPVWSCTLPLSLFCLPESKTTR